MMKHSPIFVLRAVLASMPVFALASAPAFAVNDHVRNACDSDYAAYCAQFDVDSKEVRGCMRANRHKLTDKCLHALADSGEATPADVRRYKDEKAGKAR